MNKQEIILLYVAFPCALFITGVVLSCTFYEDPMNWKGRAAASLIGFIFALGLFLLPVVAGWFFGSCMIKLGQK